MKALLIAMLAVSSFASVIQPEFTESSFDFRSQEEAQKKTYCYTAPYTADVCSEIYAQEAYLNMDYYNGGHATMNVKSCVVSPVDAIVHAEYSMRDDYGGDFTVKREIAPCE